METIKNEKCPLCGEKKLTLTEDEEDIPFFGKTYIYSMRCDACGFFKSDVEAAERKEPCKITFTVENTEDLKVRVVKSSEASVKIPQLKMEVTPGPDSIGYVSNIEGVIERFEKIIQDRKREAEEEGDEEVRKNAKNLLKKLWNVKCGEMPLKIIIEDPSGNSAIISEKAIVEKLKIKNEP